MSKKPCSMSKKIESLNKNEANIDDLKNMVVSDGTMRPKDLIPKFLNVLKMYAEDRYDDYIQDNPEVLDLKGLDDETLGYIVDELFDELNYIAPDEYYFGQSEGDAACFGFWEVEPRESIRKSEKRTVQPPSYDVYTYDELSPEAKEKVKKTYIEHKSEMPEWYEEDCMSILREMFPNSKFDFQFSLTYSQGDGFNTSGTLNVNDLIDVDLSHFILKDSSIKPLSDKAATKAACEEAGISEIELPENRRYGYSKADLIELTTDSGYSILDLEDSLSPEEYACLEDLERFARSVMTRINGEFEEDGYAFFYEPDDSEVEEWALCNDYEFREDGTMV